MPDSPKPLTIVGIAGSLRAGSLNAALLRAAAELAPSDVHVEIESIRDIPLYDGDLELARGIPPAVQHLKDRIAHADGVLMVSPEYNGSIPGVLKNAIDWLTRPPKDIATVFAGRPLALAGATPGRGATALAQAAWLPVLRALGVRPWFGPRLGVGAADQAFAVEGGVPAGLVEARQREQVAEFVRGFAAFIRSGA